MNAPVFAAFAPGVLVWGRIVSATSSRNATSSGVKVLSAAVAPGGRSGVFGAATGEQRAPADERDAAEHGSDAADGLAARDHLALGQLI